MSKIEGDFLKLFLASQNIWTLRQCAYSQNLLQYKSVCQNVVWKW